MTENSKLDDVFDMLLDFQQQRDEMQDKQNDYQRRIKEIEYYIDSIIDIQDDDYRVFSPRVPDNKNKEEVERAKAEKLDLQKKSNDLSIEIEKISHYIDVIELNLKNNTTEVKTADVSVLEIQEKERQRIAADLHDTALQNLTYILHKLELAEMFMKQDPTRAKLELNVIRKNIKAVVDQVRDSIYDLRPMSFNDVEFKSILERMLDTLNADQKYKIESDIQNVSCETSIVLITLYRVIQECFSNIIKHSNCDKVIFKCSHDFEYIYVTIEDNGEGFEIDDVTNSNEKHFGILVMQERIGLLNGEILIKSGIGQGCKIEIKVPKKQSVVS